MAAPYSRYLLPEKILTSNIFVFLDSFTIKVYFSVNHFNIWKSLVFCKMFEWFNMWTLGNVSLSDSPPVKLSDDSAETKKSNNLEGAEQGADAVVIVVKGVEDIVGEAGEQVDQEPGL